MIKVKTELLRGMINKALKVCSFNKMLPLTELMELKIENGYLAIRTTDNITHVSVNEKVEDAEESMRVVVDAALIAALINKITTPEVELIVSEKALTINGNGTYCLDIRIDENGSIIKFPELTSDANKIKKQVDFKRLIEKMNICKVAIPDNFDSPELNNYYIKENIITTNAFKISSIDNIEELKDEELFITKDLGRIMIDLNLDKMGYYIEENKLIMMSNNLVVVSTIGEDLDKFPLKAITGLLASNFKTGVTIKRKKLLDLLDRLSLFVTEFDENSINISFEENIMNITSAKKTGTESIEYVGSISPDDAGYKCKINIVYIKEQIECLGSEEINIFFGGTDNAIKIVSGNVNQIICLMTEE